MKDLIKNQYPDSRSVGKLETVELVNAGHEKIRVSNE